MRVYSQHQDLSNHNLPFTSRFSPKSWCEESCSLLFGIRRSATLLQNHSNVVMTHEARRRQSPLSDMLESPDFFFTARSVSSLYCTIDHAIEPLHSSGPFDLTDLLYEHGKNDLRACLSSSRINRQQLQAATWAL